MVVPPGAPSPLSIARPGPGRPAGASTAPGSGRPVPIASPSAFRAPIPTDDRQLRRVRAQATALLLLAVAVFVVSHRGDDDGWVGYVQAASEAALIGGLADWFAVTALFRHPLGIPIPHTAILPTRKDALGVSLGSFVEANFFDDQVVAERIGERELAARLGRWLTDPGHAARVVDQVAVAVRNVEELLDDDLVSDETGHLVLERLRQVPVAPMAARVIRTGLTDGRMDRLVDRALGAAVEVLEHYRPLFRSRLGQESPWWVPEFVDERVYRRIEAGVRAFAEEMAADPDHPFRTELEERARALAERLEDGGSEAERLERWWAELLELPEVRRWAASLWASSRRELVAYVEDPASPVRSRLERTVAGLGRRLLDDAALRASVDRWIGASVDRTLGALRTEVSDLIATTVARWDARDASRRIELAVGADLQYIRINGTLVGALLGLLIHLIGLLLG